MNREARITENLPEKFGLLYNYKNGKFDTPLNEQGIADIDATVELAIRTFPDELPSFTEGERNIHHIYWSESWWKQYATRHPTQDAKTILEFRDSPPQKAYLPVPIHAWIEEIMIPPMPPDLQTMRRRNASWAAATILLKSAKLVDDARANYRENAYKPRVVLGRIPGVTPRSQQRDFETKEVVDQEYWLSELQHRLNGWYRLTHEITEPDRLQIITTARLTSVRALRRRIHRGSAMIPRVPAELLSA